MDSDESDDGCPILVPVDVPEASTAQSNTTKFDVSCEKVPVTIITGFLGKENMPITWWIIGYTEIFVTENGNFYLHMHLLFNDKNAVENVFSYEKWKMPFKVEH